jgi:hypothetical protein
MTTAASLSTIAAVPGSAPIFQVVPVIPDDGSVENVFYYAPVDGEQYWEKISPKDLNTKQGGSDADGVMLYQPDVETILRHTHLTGDQLDRSVTLYAGVARTLSINEDPLPSACQFDGNRFMLVPVAPHTTRGVILVFSKRAAGKSSAPVVELIATTDPEIKNGVGK